LILESRSMAKFCEHHAPALACRAASMADGLASLLRDFRTLSHELHPRNLDDVSLAMSARRLIDEFGDRAGFTIGFREERVPERLATPLPTCLFRLLQENLSNISKHAKATHVEVALVGRDGHIHLTVSDNGQGFDADAVMQNRTGIGLLGMQERVRPLNGTVQIESRPGVGTTVSITIPLPREEETLASFR
jgi:two-component system sensor histidine kinase UhpB